MAHNVESTLSQRHDVEVNVDSAIVRYKAVFLGNIVDV